MKDKKKIGIIVGAVAVIIAVIIGVIASRGGNEGARLQKLLDAGAKYLAELDYEQAVVAYNEAITLDPKNVDAYIGLAEAYLGMGDFDAAREALEAGYAATGEQIFQDWITSIWESSQEPELPAEEPSESEEESVEDDIWGYVEFDFDPKDVTIMGYDLFENHYAEISAAVLSDLMTNTNLYYQWESDYGVTYYKGRDANEREYSVDIEDEAYNLDYGLVNGWSLEYDGDNFLGTGGTAFNMNIWSEDLFKIQDFISAPLFGNESYEDAAQLLRIDEIKENGRPTPDNNEEVARYYFKSNLGNCIYSEGMYGEEERISWHQLDIYYEDGKTFYISFERRNTGLIFDCNYGVLTEDNGYPDYLWTESWWEAAFK